MIALGFKGQINPSIQVGDLAFYAKITDSLGGFTTSNNLLSLGVVNVINTSPGEDSYLVDGVAVAVDYIISIEQTSGQITPGLNDFVFFAKDNEVNMSSILGYYALAEFKNNDYENKAELFATSCGISESSK